jgi:hypothetical protein
MLLAAFSAFLDSLGIVMLVPETWVKKLSRAPLHI